MVSIRSKKKKAFRTVKRQTVFQPVEDARFKAITDLLYAPRPEEEKPKATEEEKTDDAMDQDQPKLTRLAREQIMLSRNQFKKRQRARSVSKKAKAKVVKKSVGFKKSK
ncbi:UNVERIFIED_CONTAM: hypothetical protein HDU68_000465 [Siphonaria sp. JEL0065]|nr:hypothetical protein HDU68_000465 [Siphonaria sp. JEL0065]